MRRWFRQFRNRLEFEGPDFVSRRRKLKKRGIATFDFLTVNVARNGSRSRHVAVFGDLATFDKPLGGVVCSGGFEGRSGYLPGTVRLTALSQG